MSDSRKDRRSDRPLAVMPVTRLISRPSLTVVNGQLAAIKVLIDRKAA